MIGSRLFAAEAVRLHGSHIRPIAVGHCLISDGATSIPTTGSDPLRPRAPSVSRAFSLVIRALRRPQLALLKIALLEYAILTP
jgi:hypothetical protein